MHFYPFCLFCIFLKKSQSCIHVLEYALIWNAGFVVSNVQEFAKTRLELVQIIIKVYLRNAKTRDKVSR